MTRSTRDEFIEWISACTGFGPNEAGKVSLVFCRHNKNDVSSMPIREGLLAKLCTILDNYSVFHAIDRTKPVGASSISVSSIEEDVYDSTTADNKTKFCLLNFIQETGFLSAQINVWKRVFESNGKVSIAIFIEETMSIENKA